MLQPIGALIGFKGLGSAVFSIGMPASMWMLHSLAPRFILKVPLTPHLLPQLK